jgi:hypothetical protein
LPLLCVVLANDEQGATYKFGVTVQSKGFSEAPDSILKAVHRMKWAGVLGVQMANEMTNTRGVAAGNVHNVAAVNFNECLSLGYMQGDKINVSSCFLIDDTRADQSSQYHDDGETTVGPTVASLSLGSPATMHFRPKAHSGMSPQVISPQNCRKGWHPWRKVVDAKEVMQAAKEVMEAAKAAVAAVATDDADAKATAKAAHKAATAAHDAATTAHNTATNAAKASDAAIAAAKASDPGHAGGAGDVANHDADLVKKNLYSDVLQFPLYHGDLLVMHGHEIHRHYEVECFLPCPMKIIANKLTAHGRSRGRPPIRSHLSVH